MVNDVCLFLGRHESGHWHSANESIARLQVSKVTVKISNMKLGDNFLPMWAIRAWKEMPGKLVQAHPLPTIKELGTDI